jgi:hypothetical protein
MLWKEKGSEEESRQLTSEESHHSSQMWLMVFLWNCLLEWCPWLKRFKSIVVFNRREWMTECCVTCGKVVLGLFGDSAWMQPAQAVGTREAVLLCATAFSRYNSSAFDNHKYLLWQVSGRLQVCKAHGFSRSNRLRSGSQSYYLTLLVISLLST